MSAERRPRGRPTWVSGTKFAFLNQYSSDWQKATDASPAAAGLFYTKVAKRFIKKYGWHFNRWTDKDCPDPDPATIDEDDSQDGLSNEEIAKRHEYYREIRTLIMAWFHSHYTKVNSQDALEMEQVFNDESLPKPPRRMRMTQFYSKHCYNSRIKPVFEAELTAAYAIPNAKPSRINILNSVTRRLWENETPTFRSYLEGKRNEEHAKEMEEHNRVVKDLQLVAGSAETYHSVLNNAAVFLQPLVDLVAKKYGAAASLLLVLPIGSNDGEIELRSVHSGVTNGLVPQTWPTFDREGFDGVQRSMVNFGKHVFSLADRNARVLGGKVSLPISESSPLLPERRATSGDLDVTPNDRSISSFDSPERPLTSEPSPLLPERRATSGDLDVTPNDRTISSFDSPERPLTSEPSPLFPERRATSGGLDVTPNDRTISSFNSPQRPLTSEPSPLFPERRATSGGLDATPNDRTISSFDSPQRPLTSESSPLLPERRATSGGPPNNRFISPSDPPEHSSTSGGPDAIQNDGSSILPYPLRSPSTTGGPDTIQNDGSPISTDPSKRPSASGGPDATSNKGIPNSPRSPGHLSTYIGPDAPNDRFTSSLDPPRRPSTSGDAIPNDGSSSFPLSPECLSSNDAQLSTTGMHASSPVSSSSGQLSDANGAPPGSISSPKLSTSGSDSLAPNLGEIELADYIEDIPSRSKNTYEAVLKDAHSWGPVWSKCVLAFLKFEKAAGFPLDDGRLPASCHRPYQLSEWFKYGRKTSGQCWDNCCEGDGDIFGEGWRAWWSDMQHNIREHDSNGALSRNQVNIDWAGLCRAGSSGMLLVLVTLLWWRSQLGQTESLLSLANWEDAVNDVVWVLGSLKDAASNKASTTSQKKRKIPSTLEGSRKRRKN